MRWLLTLGPAADDEYGNVDATIISSYCGGGHKESLLSFQFALRRRIQESLFDCCCTEVAKETTRVF